MCVQRLDQSQEVDCLHFITVPDDMSGHWYLRSCACMLRFWVALVCGDGVDNSQYDGVLFLLYASVLKGVFLMRL